MTRDIEQDRALFKAKSLWFRRCFIGAVFVPLMIFVIGERIWIEIKGFVSGIRYGVPADVEENFLQIREMWRR